MTASTKTQMDLMRMAIAEAKEGIAVGQSPFGAVVATPDGKVVAAAHNLVRAHEDATAHAEIVAIRRACSHLATIELSGHVLATTCEPCPMCAAAIHWAKLDAVIYGAEISDARDAGFNELSLPIAVLYQRGGSSVQVQANVLREECRELFQLWKQGPNATPY